MRWLSSDKAMFFSNSQELFSLLLNDIHIDLALLIFTDLYVQCDIASMYFSVV